MHISMHLDNDVTSGECDVTSGECDDTQIKNNKK